MLKTRRQTAQRGLWDRLTGKQPAVVAPSVNPALSATNWPDPETPVRIIGDTTSRIWAVVDRLDCGKQFGQLDAYALIVPYSDRQNPWWKQKAAILIERLEVAR